MTTSSPQRISAVTVSLVQTKDIMFDNACATLVSVSTIVILSHTKSAPVYLIHAAENDSAHSSEGHTIGLQI